MKRVAFVLPKMAFGGVEKSFLSLLQFAPKEELDVTLILLEDGGELLPTVPEWVHICIDESSGKTEKTRRIISAKLRGLNLKWLFKVAKSIYHAIGPSLIMSEGGAEEFDIAVAYNDGMATWYTAKGVNAKKKIAFIHTDIESAGYNPKVEREVYPCFQQIVFASEQGRRHFLNMLPECTCQTLVLPTFVDSAKVRSMSEEYDPLFDHSQINIVSVGRLSHEKGMGKIPSILQGLKREGIQAHWYIVGDGIEYENILKEATDREVVSMLTMTGRKENPYPFIANCDIYVQPSNYEGYCIALAEAIVLKKPCVACNFSGAAEQIREGETGFVTGMSPLDMLPKIEMLAVSRELRHAFSKNIEENPEADKNRYVLWWSSL